MQANILTSDFEVIILNQEQAFLFALCSIFLPPFIWTQVICRALIVTEAVRCFFRQFMSLWIYCQLLFRLFLKFTSLKTPGNDACLTGKGSLSEGNAFLIILIIRPCLADEWWQRQSDKVCEKYFLLLLLRSSFSSWHIVPRYELSLCTIENACVWYLDTDSAKI